MKDVLEVLNDLVTLAHLAQHSGQLVTYSPYDALADSIEQARDFLQQELSDENHRNA